jgi:16S rRNA (adenine1518-N6/adenine1519-N6)-dimethyltransferase
MPQTKRDIQAILTAAGLSPLKRYGQHFLIDGNLMHKLIEAADIGPEDVVLEVGPGTGALTELLVEQAGHVISVEIDKGLHALCRERLGQHTNLTLIHGDILARKSAINADVLRRLEETRASLGGRAMLVANLPYQIATPLIAGLIMHSHVVSPLCFTVQAEVAERFTASPATRDYGPVSVLVQAMAVAHRIARVPPAAFWPVPQVDSTMLRLDRKRSEDAPAPAVRGRLNPLVHDCFQHRRKTLKWNLRRILNDESLARVVSDGRWDLTARPEQLAVDDWITLAEALTVS